jgi:hypothetical protein
MVEIVADCHDQMLHTGRALIRPINSSECVFKFGLHLYMQELGEESIILGKIFLQAGTVFDTPGV